MYDIVILTGPTATGKTDSAIAFAQRFNGQIVSADSMLVYRGMDIGTAKPTQEQREAVVHHMIDVADPSENFSVARWQQGAQEAISAILQDGKLPVIVGGTGLYVRAVLYPMDFAGTKGNEEVRDKWEAFGKIHGAQALHEALARIDEPSAQRLHPNDTRRVIRALEVYELTGQTLTEKMAQDAQKKPRYRALTMAVDLPRQVLYDRIDRRVDSMMAQGLVREVERLRESGVADTATSMQGLGYKEITAYLKKELSLTEATELLKQRTRHFAKRQLTWFRADPSIRWLHADGPCETKKITDFFAETFQSKMNLW